MNNNGSKGTSLIARKLMTADEIKHISPTPAIHGAHIALYIILFATTFFLTYVAASFSNLSIFS